MTRRLLLSLPLALLLAACGGANDAAAEADASAASPASATAAAAKAAPTGGTAAWDRLVKKHVRDGGVDYAAVARDRADLDAFLAHVRRTDPAKLSKNERIAFLTNAYNAVVVHQVLELYPNVPTVKDVDGFFDEKTFPVGGKAMTLDAVEAAARELDPRVHFTVVCASTSCPDLRAEAYTGRRIEQQLREQTQRFLADPSKGLRYDEKANELHLSSIFKWYAQDFTDTNRVVAFFARGGVRDWVVEHLGDRRLAARLREREPAVKYMDYDWSLNDR